MEGVGTMEGVGMEEVGMERMEEVGMEGEGMGMERMEEVGMEGMGMEGVGMEGVEGVGMEGVGTMEGVGCLDGEGAAWVVEDSMHREVEALAEVGGFGEGGCPAAGAVGEAEPSGIPGSNQSPSMSQHRIGSQGSKRSQHGTRPHRPRQDPPL